MKKTYSEKLRDPRWQKKRLEILERDNWTCVKCGEDADTLHVHHKKYSGNPWESDNNDLETVCNYCHQLIHDLKIQYNEAEDLQISIDRNSEYYLHTTVVVGTINGMNESYLVNWVNIKTYNGNDYDFILNPNQLDLICKFNSNE